MLSSLALWEILLPAIGLRGFAQRGRSTRLHNFARQYRSLAVQLGGVLIKVGQFLSARVDVLPAEVTDELSGLQDEVPAEDFDAIRRVVEDEFNRPLNEIFVEFSELPVASASLGQVHQAEVAGQQVVVKVQRPDIEGIIATDLAALRTVGKWLQRYRPISRRANIPALLNEFSRILYEEIDYLAEGRNAETFAANLEGRPDVHIPAVFWTHTTRRVLTLEDVRAIKITDFEAITAAGISRTAVAERLFDLYLRQIFEDGFFHADPHPGNLFVQPMPDRAQEVSGAVQQDPNWKLVFVDFGMVGRVPANLQEGLRELLIAMATREPARMVHAFQLLGVLLPGANLELIERAESMAFEQLWGKNMRELQQFDPRQMRALMLEFRELIYDMPFQMPEDLILLGRTIGILAGLCTGLDPEFNVWQGLTPYAQKLILQEAGSQWRVWLDELGVLARILLSFPRRIDGVVSKLERGDLTVRDPLLVAQVIRLERSINRLAAGLVFLGLLLGGIQLNLAGKDALSAVMLGGAGLTLGWLLLTGLRRR